MQPGRRGALRNNAYNTSLAGWEAAFDLRCELSLLRLEATIVRAKHRYLLVLLAVNAGLYALTLALFALLLARYG